MDKKRVFFFLAGSVGILKKPVETAYSFNKVVPFLKKRGSLRLSEFYSTLLAAVDGNPTEHLLLSLIQSALYFG